MRGFGKGALHGDATRATEESQMPQSARPPDDLVRRARGPKTLISKPYAAFLIVAKATTAGRGAPQSFATIEAARSD